MIHPVARGFATAAEVYEQARPGYPAEALDWIVESIPGRDVLDLAAGTGKLTRLLVARGLRVIAVEPIAEMRAVLERVVPQARAFDGTAERIPAANASFDGVTVGQAFHWFDHERAYAEIHRVLRGGGVLAAVWNVRDDSDAVSAAFGELLEPLRGGQPTRGHSLPATELFDVAEREFAHGQVLDADGLVARAASVSFVAQLPEEERDALLVRVRALAPKGEFELPYVTKVFTCRRR